MQPPYGADIPMNPQLARELIREYADVLRVGRLLVNGTAITWQIGGSMEEQLQRLCAALIPALRRAPHSARLSDAMMQKSVYWLCKSLSINYILMEVLQTIRQRVGVLCTIEGSQDSAGADFSLEIAPGPIFRVALAWRGSDNIVYRDPQSAERRVKGTIRRLETEFPVPPDPGVAPTYTVHLEIKRSMASKLFSSMSCSDTCADQEGSSPTSLAVSPSVPLRSGFEDEGGMPVGMCCDPTFGLLQSWLPWLFSDTQAGKR